MSDATTQTLRARVDQLHARIGSLSIHAPGPNLVGSTILVDGKPLAVRTLKLEATIDGVWTVTIEYLPNIEMRAA